jgi:hypothetical protein
MNKILSVFFALTFSACGEVEELTQNHVTILCDISGDNPSCTKDKLAKILNDKYNNNSIVAPGSTFNVFIIGGKIGDTKTALISDPYPIAFGRNIRLGQEWLNNASNSVSGIKLSLDAKEKAQNHSDIIGALIYASTKKRDGYNELIIISDGRHIDNFNNMEKGKVNMAEVEKRMSQGEFKKFDSFKICGLSFDGITESNHAKMKSFWQDISFSISEHSVVAIDC